MYESIDASRTIEGFYYVCFGPLEASAMAVSDHSLTSFVDASGVVGARIGRCGAEANTALGVGWPQKNTVGAGMPICNF